MVVLDQEQEAGRGKREGVRGKREGVSGKGGRLIFLLPACTFLLHCGFTMNPSRLGFFLLGITLSFGFIVGADRIGKAIAYRRTSPELSVRGVATQPAKADVATMVYGVSWRGENYAAGRTQLEQRRDVLVAKLQSAGIPLADIQVRAQDFNRYLPAPVGTKPENMGRFARGTVPDFEIEQQIAVRTSKVDTIAKLALEPVEFVDDVIISRSAPAYRIAQLDEAKRELLESATKDARRRADVLVTGSGSKVGSLLEASQGMFEVTSPDNPESDFDTTSINKVIRVVVTLRFEITKE